ncbi:MAG: hypothetical protein OHK0022_59980 [Roseiflexaceae bacterium]
MPLPFRPVLRVLARLLLLVALLGAQLPLVAQAQTTGGKRLVLVGGGLKDDNAAIYNRIIDLAGGRSAARIGIITAASGSPASDPNAGTSSASNYRDNGTYYVNLFKNTYGVANAEWIPIHIDAVSNNSSPTVVSQINGMTGFFFGGGDQSRLITSFFLNSGGTRTDSPALTAIRQRFAAGAVVAGTSAGTAIMSGTPMITGGESYEALRYAPRTSISTSYPDDLSYDPRGGFGLFGYGPIDTHFSERGRQGRIIRLASATGKSMAYGVDENTALVVTNADSSSARMEVVGQNGVFIFDLGQATVGTGSYWSISGVRASYLTSGDSFNPSTKQFSIASWKTNLAGREIHSRAMTPTTDIFSSANNSTSSGRRNPRMFVTVTTDLFDSRSTTTTGQTYETGPTFEAKFSKVTGSIGYQGYQNSVNFYAYVNLRVDLYRY